MKNFFVPTGTAYFPGSYMQLMRVIGSVYGVLEDADTFSCKSPFPRSNIGSIGCLMVFRKQAHLAFKFRCKIERNEDSCKITYCVYPAFTTMFCLGIIAFVLVNGLLNADIKELFASVLACISFIGIFLVVFLVERHTAIRRFVRKFEEEYESYYD